MVIDDELNGVKGYGLSSLFWFEENRRFILVLHLQMES